MEEVEAHAERVLASVPSWLWHGESLPVPVDDIAEPGHHCPHQHPGAPVWCRTSSVEESAPVAAALLMPARLIRRRCRQGTDCFAFRRRFGASASAMGKRPHQVV